jgi:hypothetical protein
MEELKIAREEYAILCNRIRSGSYDSFDLDMIDLIYTWIVAAENTLKLSKTNVSAPVPETKQDGTHDGIHDGKPN